MRAQPTNQTDQNKFYLSIFLHISKGFFSPLHFYLFSRSVAALLTTLYKFVENKGGLGQMQVKLHHCIPRKASFFAG